MKEHRPENFQIVVGAEWLKECSVAHDEVHATCAAGARISVRFERRDDQFGPAELRRINRWFVQVSRPNQMPCVTHENCEDERRDSEVREINWIDATPRLV